ncbi:MAG: Sec-independent protein translocase subunit TatA [Nocardioidaceae bacterium]
MSGISVVPMGIVGGLGAPELLLILLVVVLLFGAKKLPDLARGSGRALRIFKAETKGLLDDEDDDKQKTEEQRQLDAQASRDREYPQTPRQTQYQDEPHRPESDR